MRNKGMRGDATGGDRSGGAGCCGLLGAPSGVSVPVSVGCTGGGWHRGRASAKQQIQGSDRRAPLGGQKAGEGQAGGPCWMTGPGLGPRGSTKSPGEDQEEPCSPERWAELPGDGGQVPFAGGHATRPPIGAEVLRQLVHGDVTCQRVNTSPSHTHVLCLN